MKMEIQNFQKTCNTSKKDELPALVNASASPHEFSFTISFHQHQPSTTIGNSKSLTNSPAVDLSPADDIFFHGHLLPLHLLSHLPVSPRRSSTNSLDSFTLPITELFFDDPHQIVQENSTNDDIEFTNFQQLNATTSTSTAATRSRVIKSKSFSIFGGRKRGSQRQDQERQKNKLKSEVSHVLKKYMRMLRPLLSFRGSRKSMNKSFPNQSYSFPGSVSSRKKQDEFRGRRGLFSAPASMRTSPTNSGLLIATAAAAGSTSDNTMEELQAAIQSAITHCKNSIAAQDKIKCKDV